MPSRKKTSKAFKSLKKDKYSSKDSLGGKTQKANLVHLLQLQQQQKNKRAKTDLAMLPTAIVFNKKLQELEERKKGKGNKVKLNAELKLAPATFSFAPQAPKPDIMFADTLLDEEEHLDTVKTNSNNGGKVRYFQSLTNRFGGLSNDDDDEAEEESCAKNIPIFNIKPGTFDFPRPNPTLEDDDI